MPHPYPTNVMQRMLVTPTNIGEPPGIPGPQPPTLTGLQVGLRFSWWPPYSASPPALSAGFGDVSPSIDLTGINLGNAGAVQVVSDSKWQFANQFDGVSDYCGTTDFEDLRWDWTKPITFVAWVKCEDILPLTTTRPILSKMTGALSGEFQLYLVNAGGRAAVRFEVITPDFGGRVYFVQGTSPVPINQWVMITAMFDPATKRTTVMVGGSLTQTSQFLSATHATSADFELGARTATGHYFKGKIDEVTRWNRLLTFEEINWLRVNDLWNGVLPVSRLSSGDPLEYPVAETDLPAAPGNVEAFDESGEAALVWTDNQVGVGNVEIWREIDGGGYSLLTRLSADVGYFLDTGTDTSTYTYSYKLKATNANGESGFTSVVSVGSGGGSGAIIDGEGTITDGEGTITDGET